MRRKELRVRIWAALVFAAASLLSGTPIACAEPPTLQDLLDKVNALQAEVDQLKAEREQERQERRSELAARTKPTADAVRVDADRHGRLVDLDTFTAGYMPDRGFMLRSDSRDFMLHPFVVLQFRNNTTYRENGKSGGRSDLENGFEVRRLKFGADGNLFNQNLTYQFIGSVDRHGGAVTLEDAWTRYQFTNSPFYVRAGQLRDPLDHEQIVFAPFLLTVERSLADDIFTGADGLVQGVGVGFDRDGPIRGEFVFSDGLRSQNTNFQDFPTAGIASDWGVAGRVDWKLSGDWKQYSSFSALNAKKTLAVLGAGADYTEAGDTQQLTHAVDAQLDCLCGLSLYGAYLGRYVNHNGGPPGTNGGSATALRTTDTYDSSVRAEAGFLLTRHFEPFVRYEYIRFDSAELPSTTRRNFIHEFTAGCNYYFAGQRARLSADLSYLPDGSPVTDDGSGVLMDNGTNEVVIRAQFQLIL